MEQILSITAELWLIFSLIIGISVLVDLGIVHKIRSKLGKGSKEAKESEHVLSFRASLAWTIVWIGLAGVFAVIISFTLGQEKMIEFVTGYTLEKSLSVDNMFVFLLIFTSLGIPHKYQHRVLSVGILSAIVMRIGIILVGTSLLDTFHWMIYVFGGLLWFTSIRMLVQKKEKKIELEKNLAVKALKKVMPVKLELVGSRFIVSINSVLHATPLLVALAIIEMTDLVFAVDSIPAVLAITTDPFIVITSNIFAIFGLRALYFLIGGMLEKFYYLKPGLVVLLFFIGTKMLISDLYHISTATSLVVVFTILGVVMAASLIKSKKLAKR